MRTGATEDGGSVEVGPAECPNGHPLKYPNVLIGGDVEKRTYLCRKCGMQIEINHKTGVATIVKRSPA